MRYNAYHFVADTLRDGSPVPADGETLKHDGELVLCASGLHASRTAWQALTYATGATLCRVHCGGRIIEPDGEDKLVCSERTIIQRIDAAALLRDFARSCARDVLHLWDAPDVVREYLETGDESKRAAARAAAWDAARAARAAGYAAWDAARAAAWDAAGDAAGYAGYAAWDAARAAAWDAAGYAARAAAWDAAWDAARAAAWDAAGYAGDAAWDAARAAAWDAAWDVARDAQGKRFIAMVDVAFEGGSVMTNINPIFRAYLRLRDATDNLTIAQAHGLPEWHKAYNINHARENIAAALVPDAEPKHGEAEEWLVDLIATAITDSTDLGYTSESQARYIVDELFKHLRPEASE